MYVSGVYVCGMHACMPEGVLESESESKIGKNLESLKPQLPGSPVSALWESRKIFRCEFPFTAEATWWQQPGPLGT